MCSRLARPNCSNKWSHVLSTRLVGVDMDRQSKGVTRQSVDVARQCVDVARQCVDVARQSVDVARQCVNVARLLTWLDSLLTWLDSLLTWLDSLSTWLDSLRAEAVSYGGPHGRAVWLEGAACRKQLHCPSPCTSSPASPTHCFTTAATRCAHHHLLLQHIASPQPPLAVHNTDDDADAKRERLSSRLGNLAH